MTFTCSDCGQTLEMQTIHAGQVVACPSCNARILAQRENPPATVPAGDISIDLQSVKESLQSGIDKGRVTISTLMANQQLHGGVELEADTLTPDRTSVSDALTAQPEMKYLIGDIIARGNTQAVISAKDINLRRNVAMKVLIEPQDASKARILRFIKEAQVTGQLEHPGIVPLHELGIYGGDNVFYTMKHIKGKTLSEVLQEIRDGNEQTIADNPLSHLLTIFQKVCDAIAFAHSKRVLHLDLKPENIMFGDYGEVLVLDWGLAKVLPKKQKKDVPDYEPSKAQDEAVSGTPEFMAPEQAMGKNEKLDRRTDIYSLGAILYNILTLAPPAAETSHARSKRKITRSKASSIFQNNGKIRLRHLPDARVPKSLAAICTKALQPEHGKRYQTVKELQKDIESYQNGFATSAEQAGIRRQVQLLVRRHKTITALAVSIILFAAIAGMVSTTLWIRAKNATSAALEEKQVAAKALTALKDCAPDMVELSSMFMEKEQVEEALKRISYAVELMPGNAHYRYLKGNALETLLKLKEAEQAYDEALQLDPTHNMARENKRLCRKIMENSMGFRLLANTTIGELYTAIRSQERYYEAIALARYMISNSGGTIVENLIKETLDSAGVKYTFPGIDTQGECRLSLSSTLITDLAPLRGLPLTQLSLYNTRIKDLSALKGMSLTWLDISSTGITDLTPLSGMPLVYFNAGYNGLTDLSPLKDSRLKKAFLAGNRIKDIDLLTEMPLDELDLRDTGFQDFAALKGLPLTRLGINGLSDLSLISKLNLTYLNLRGSRCINLSPLTNMPLQSLVLDQTPVSDLSPLKGMNLTELSISNAPINDLSPLNDLPLKTLTMDRPKIRLLPQVRAIKALASIQGLDLYSLLAPCNQSIAEKNFTRARKQAGQIINEWSDVPALSELCKYAKWTLEVSIPLAEKPGEPPPGALTNLGHHFYMAVIPLNWDDAKKFCENIGGHLATPVSSEKWNWLTGAFPEHDGTWLGGFKDPVSGLWKWVTGEEWAYSAWGPRQPDNSGGKENVLNIYEGGFNDANRIQLNKFIIEWDK